MHLPPDFRDPICAFNDAGVEYLVVGGYAVAVHGRPRYTGDMDFFFRRTLQNAEKIILALKICGYTNAEVTAESLIDPGVVHYFGQPPLRIDPRNTLSGVEFEQAWMHRVNVDQESLNLPVMSKCISSPTNGRQVA